MAECGRGMHVTVREGIQGSVANHTTKVRDGNWYYICRGTVSLYIYYIIDLSSIQDIIKVNIMLLEKPVKQILD